MEWNGGFLNYIYINLKVHSIEYFILCIKADKDICHFKILSYYK